MKLDIRSAVLLVSLGTLVAVGAAKRPGEDAADTWPQWRGPDGQGVSTARDVPLEWGEGKNILWKTAIPGKGHSSPVIWGDRIFLTTAIEGEQTEEYKPARHFINGEEFVHPDGVAADRINQLKVFALDRVSGRIVWERTAYEGPVYDSRHKRNTRASETPAIDGEMIYAYFGSAGLYAYDFAGNLAWKKNLGDIGTYGVGTGSSPILYENLLIVLVDNEDGESSYLIALDKKTGEEVWKVARKVEISWATPVIAKSASGRDELVTSGNEMIIAYDPATGKELWSAKGLGSNAVPSPVAGDGIVVVSSGFPEKRVIAIRLGGSDDVTETENLLWRYNKGTGYIPSPILYGEYVYLISDAGLITCLHTTTGEVVYEGGRVPIPSRFVSSITAFDGKLLLNGTGGDSFIIQAGPEHKVLVHNSLPESIWSTPAILDGHIYMRGASHLYAIADANGEEEEGKQATDEN